MKKSIARLFPAVAGLVIALAPALSFAEQPEIDCNTLDEPTYNHFYSDLAQQLDEATSSDNWDEALKVALEAMSICTTDVYTEYWTGKLFYKKNDLPNACYHFDHLYSHSDGVKKENKDVYKEVDKMYKKIKDECAKFQKSEVTCEQSGVSLSITGEGVSMHHVDCPYYGYLIPGTYSVKASKQGFDSKLVEFVVGESSDSVHVPELDDPNARGHIEVKCPRGSTGFTLTDDKGKVSEFQCPYIGDVMAGTYTVKLVGVEAEPTQLVVERQGNVSHEIPGAISTSCSATPISNTSAPLFAGAFALLAALGFAVRRRRDAE